MVWFFIWLVIKVNFPNWDGVCQAVQREKWKLWNWNPASSNCQKCPIIRESLIISLKFLWLKSQIKKITIIHKESWHSFYKNATKCIWMVDIKTIFKTNLIDLFRFSSITWLYLDSQRTNITFFDPPEFSPH